MKILVDENIPVMTVQALQQMGHEVKDIHGRVLQAMNHFSEEEWPGLVVMMRDVAQSTWRRQ